MLSTKTFSSTDTESYEQRRQKNKNGELAGTFLMFKSTVGLGLLIVQFYIGKSGLLLGPLSSLLIIAIMGYSIFIIVRLADNIESEKGSTKKIQTIDQVVGAVYGETLQTFTKVLNFFFNMAFINVNMISLVRFLNTKFQLYAHQGSIDPIILYKISVLLIVVTIVVCILEPEKLKYIAIFSSSVLLIGITLMWILNLLKIGENEQSFEFGLFNVYGLANLVGSLMYSVESIGLVFTVRSTLKEPIKMQRIVVNTFIAVAVLFIITGLSFLLVC